MRGIVATGPRPLLEVGKRAQVKVAAHVPDERVSTANTESLAHVVKLPRRQQ